MALKTPANFAPKAPFDPRYPAPPSLHWLMLSLVWLIVCGFLAWKVPDPAGSLLGELLVDAWLLYVCIWITKLNPFSQCLTLAVAACALNIALTSVNALHDRSAVTTCIYGLLLISFLFVWWNTVSCIKTDLEKHYNEREPIGLKLSFACCFFFSPFYLQFHLHRIATQKRAQELDQGETSVYFPTT